MGTHILHLLPTPKAPPQKAQDWVRGGGRSTNGDRSRTVTRRGHLRVTPCLSLQLSPHVPWLPAHDLTPPPLLIGLLCAQVSLPGDALCSRNNLITK